LGHQAHAGEDDRELQGGIDVHFLAAGAIDDAHRLAIAIHVRKAKRSRHKAHRFAQHGGGFSAHRHQNTTGSLSQSSKVPSSSSTGWGITPTAITAATAPSIRPRTFFLSNLRAPLS